MGIDDSVNPLGILVTKTGENYNLGIILGLGKGNGYHACRECKRSEFQITVQSYLKVLIETPICILNLKLHLRLLVTY